MANTRICKKHTEIADQSLHNFIFWGKHCEQNIWQKLSKCTNTSEIIQIIIAVENKTKREVILSLSDQRKFHQIERDYE